MNHVMLSYAHYAYSAHCNLLVALSQVAYGLIVTNLDFWPIINVEKKSICTSTLYSV
jgi:hypothetical protein